VAPQDAARFRALATIARVGAQTRGHEGHRGQGLLRRVAEAARVALDGASASLSKFEPQHGQVRCLVNVGALAAAEVPEPVDEVYSLLEFGNLDLLLGGAEGIVARVDRPEVAPDYVALLRDFGKGSALAVAVPLEGRVWGELFVTRGLDEAAFDTSDLDFAIAVAAQVGAAIATAEHLDQVEQMAMTDSLTGLANRRAIDQWLDAAFEQHASEGSAVGFVLCDLNGLKRVNDELGHDAGDRALIRFAGLLSVAGARIPGALVGRLGGDEFCIATRGVPADAVVAAAEELCRLVAKSPLEGVACGVACTDDEVGPVEKRSRLYRLADAAQYRAKRSLAVRPVVAGRPLPGAVAGGLEHPHTPAERRSIRGRDSSHRAQALANGLELLDEMRDEGAEERLAAVADNLANRLDCLGWWLSRAEPGAGVIATVRFSVLRGQGGPPGGEPDLTRLIRVGDTVALDAYPQTRAAVAGGASIVLVDDPSADPGEVAYLDGIRAVSGCLAGARGADGTGWLLELYGDELTASFADPLPTIRALVLAAVAEAAPASVTAGRGRAS
jgi:diguanylate cyclase (GGDEF)-like protein